MTAPTPVDCAAFEARLADYLEGDLPLPARVAHDVHRTGCRACDALVHDLERIADAAAALGPVEPPAGVWTGIEARLAPRAGADAGADADAHADVITAANAETGTVVAHIAAPHTPSHWRPAPRHLAAAALLLVTLSAGITWTIARPRADAPVLADAAALAAARDPRDAGTAAPRPAADPLDTGANAGAAAPRPAARPLATGADADRSTTRRAGAMASDAAPAVLAARQVPDAALVLDSAYGAELALLRAAADDRLAGLDAATVDVVRRNLAIIDDAIAESRAALARDPASRLLIDQLDRAYERKVELLRRLVLL